MEKVELNYCDCGCAVDTHAGCVYRETECGTCGDARAFTGLYVEDCFTCSELETIRRQRLHNNITV